MYKQDIYSFVNQSNVGDLLLKIIMCGLPDYKAGKPLSPFWETDPYHACKLSPDPPVLSSVVLAGITSTT